MKTPDTIEGFLTECIMDRIKEKIGPLANERDRAWVQTRVYNPIYSSILEVLNERLPEIRSGGKGMTRKEYLMRGFC